MSSTQIFRDGPGDTKVDPLRDAPLLVVSIVDRSMEHAAVRRCLRTALAAMDGMRGEVTARLEGTGSIVFASETVAQLFDRIAEWHASACRTLVIASDGSTLLVEAREGGSALLVDERPPCEGRLTARERDVMRCVEEGLSNTEIAHALWIQPTTVRKHLENIFAKLEVRSRTAALSKLHGSRAKAS